MRTIGVALLVVVFLGLAAGGAWAHEEKCEYFAGLMDEIPFGGYCLSGAPDTAGSVGVPEASPGAPSLPPAGRQG